jgi:hypothetical protein
MILTQATGSKTQEMRRVRHEQRRGAWRLAKKLKNTQDQLVLMQVGYRVGCAMLCLMLMRLRKKSLHE